MIWGVTGCVGAGKSTVASILAGFGARVLDVDQVAAAALRESALGLTAAQALEAVVKGGPEKARLEAVLIPEVQRRVADWCAADSELSVLDAALLFEHGLGRFCDVTICVRCPTDERSRRVEARSTASAKLFDAIERSQWSEDEKAARSTGSIRGDQSLEALSAELRAWSKACHAP